jgi:ribosomal protein L40E
MTTHSHQESVPTKVCLRCGVQSQTGADRCPACGKRYRRPSPLFWVVLVLVIFVLFPILLTYVASQTLMPG